MIINYLCNRNILNASLDQVLFKLVIGLISSILIYKDYVIDFIELVLSTWL